MVDRESLARMTEQEKVELLNRVTSGEETCESAFVLYSALMDDGSAEVRKLAISAVWDAPELQYIEPLIDKVEHDPDPEVRARAASILGIYVHEGVVMMELPERELMRVRSFLLGTVRNEAVPMLVRRLALEALSFDTGDDVAELIEWGFGHPDKDVKMSALFAMGRSSSERWIDTIVAELNAEDRDLKLEAIGAAGEAFIEEATPTLRSLAMSKDRDVRLQAIWALARTRGPGALEVLELCATDRDEEIRHVAEDAIEEYRAYEEETEDLEEDYWREPEDDEDLQHERY